MAAYETSASFSNLGPDLSAASVALQIAWGSLMSLCSHDHPYSSIPSKTLIYLVRH
jgi:hypothetical protein